MAIKKLSNTSNISNTGHYWGTTGTTTGTLTGNGNITTTGGTIGYVYPSTTLIANPGSILQSSGNTLNWGDGITMNSDIIQYIDIFYQLMGIDMDYKRFSIMSKEEKTSFIRDIKLQKLIDEK
jgi:hypothetical protein